MATLEGLYDDDDGVHCLTIYKNNMFSSNERPLTLMVEEVEAEFVHKTNKAFLCKIKCKMRISTVNQV